MTDFPHRPWKLRKGMEVYIPVPHRTPQRLYVRRVCRDGTVWVGHTVLGPAVDVNVPNVRLRPMEYTFTRGDYIVAVSDHAMLPVRSIDFTVYHRHWIDSRVVGSVVQQGSGWTTRYSWPCHINTCGKVAEHHADALNIAIKLTLAELDALMRLAKEKLHEQA